VGGCCGYLLDRVLARAPEGRKRVVIAACALLVAAWGGASLQRAGVWQNSYLLMADATAKQPASGVAWLVYGELFEHDGRLTEAIRCEERARATCRGVECRLALGKLSELYLRANRTDDARHSIEELLRLYPGVGDGYALQGHLSYQLGALDKAEASYLQALHYTPGLVTALDALGNVYLATGRPELAMQQYEAVRRAKPQTAERAYSMACAAALLGNRSRALEYLDEALRLGYNSSDLILQNPELNAIKGEEAFGRLLQRYFPAR
jgi:tetratricopeptide (TPR) repeat protein